MLSQASGVSSTTHVMPMTTQPVVCPAPVLTADFDRCGVPGGLEFWRDWGYYSPGVCFIGYVALCTQTTAPSSGWPITNDETAVRCVPIGYECNEDTADQRYATSLYNEITLSAPAFEIRWQSRDVGPVSGPINQPPTGPATSRSTPKIGTSASPVSTAPATDLKATSGLSTGKIVGIVTGVVVAAFALSVAVFAILRKRRATETQPKSKESEIHGNTGELWAGQGECPVVELQSEGIINELASNRPKMSEDQSPINKNPVELPGGSMIRTFS